MKKKECPSCAMEIDRDEEKCPVCGYEFPKTSPGNRWLVILLILLLIIFLLAVVG